MALRELLASFGVEVDDVQLKAFDARLDSVASKVRALGGAFVSGALATGIGKFVNKNIQAGYQLDRTAEQLGISTDELQAWRFSAEQAGEGAELFDQAARMMLKNAGMSRVGIQSAADEMARWKMRVTDASGKVKPFNALLLDFADHLKAMPDRARQTRAAMAVFGFAGAKAIPWLTQGSKVLREQLKDYRMLGGGMSREFVEAAKKTEMQLQRLRFSLVAVRTGALQQILPWIERGANAVIRWSVTLQEFMKRTNAVQTAVQFFSAFLAGAFVYRIAKGITAMVQLAKAAGTLRASGNLLLASGWGVFIAAMAALYLIVEDLSIAIEGGDSAFRKFLNDLLGDEQATKFLTDLRDLWSTLKNEFAKALPNIRELGRELVKAFESAMPYITRFIAEALPSLIQFARTAVAALRAVGKAVTGDFDGALKVIDQIGNSVVGSGSLVGKAINQGALYDREGKPVMPGTPEYDQLKAAQLEWSASRPPVWQGPVNPNTTSGPQQLAGSIPAQINAPVEAHITIQGAVGPKETGDELARRLAEISREHAQTLSAVVP